IRFPATRNIDESITIATTTKTSLERIDSTSNGPSPGQLRMTSASADALSIVATENPKREISGFDAAGSAYRSTKRARGTPWPRAARRNGDSSASIIEDRI